ncbi:MAG: tripartite tricarboxylate transporter substrate binding protein [Pseudorhodoplanes sp.]|nr:tripartite tricarboxylate transporter substrate binding protein [Pseudorhodoplanes sp.]
MTLMHRAMLAVLLLASAHTTADAQAAWPDRPIRFIVTSAAGGGIDLMARILADGLSRQLPKPVVIENNGSAGGLVATKMVVNAEPDGYTFLFQGPGYAALPYIHRDPGFDVDKDFAPVSLIAQFPLVLITRPALGVKTLPEFIALVKANPGKHNFGSSGVGGASHIPLEAIKDEAGLDMAHIPFRGSGQTTGALIAGQIDLTIDGLAPQIGNIEAGTVVPLAVSTKERAPSMPNLATIGETLPGFVYPMWVAVFAPGKTPKAIVDKMSEAISNAIKDPAVKKRLDELKVTAVGSTPAELARFVSEQLAFNKAIIQKARIQSGN